MYLNYVLESHTAPYGAWCQVAQSTARRDAQFEAERAISKGTSKAQPSSVFESSAELCFRRCSSSASEPARVSELQGKHLIINWSAQTI